MIEQTYIYHMIITLSITIVALLTFYRVNRPPRKTSIAYLLVFGLVQMGMACSLISFYENVGDVNSNIEQLTYVLGLYLFFTAGWFTCLMAVIKGTETLQKEAEKNKNTEANALLNM